jgi:hypothetical protein
MKQVIYLDVYGTGFVSAWALQPSSGAGVLSTIPEKTKGVTRYRVVVELPDPHKPDADAPATIQEEP